MRDSRRITPSSWATCPPTVAACARRWPVMISCSAWGRPRFVSTRSTRAHSSRPARASRLSPTIPTRPAAVPRPPRCWPTRRLRLSGWPKQFGRAVAPISSRRTALTPLPRQRERSWRRATSSRPWHGACRPLRRSSRRHPLHVRSCMPSCRLVPRSDSSAPRWADSDSPCLLASDCAWPTRVGPLS